MVSPYEEIAGTRPRIRRDVLYTQTPTGVHFHNARGGFSVVMPSAYRFASLIVPHLDGDTTVAALCQGLGDRQRDMVTRLVGTLYARGFARDAVPPAPDAPVPEPAVARRFAAQIDYVDHYTDDAATRFLRFRDTRVAVLGEGQLARWAALSLIRNGCRTVAVSAALDTPANRFGEVTDEAGRLRAEDCPVALDSLQPGSEPGGFGWGDLDGYDVVLVTGEQGPRQVAALASGIPAGRKVVPAWTFGGSIVVGPLLTADCAGCWTCAALRLGANGDPAAAADLWAGLAPGGPRTAGDGAGTVRGPLAAMVGNLLGYEVFRLTTGALPAETENQLIIQDLDSLDTVAEPLLPHPGCPVCGALDAPADADAATDLALLGAPAPDSRADSPAEAAGAADDDPARAALAELTDRAVLVRPAAGVFREFADEAWAQTPLKVSTVSLSTGHGGRRDITAFDVHHVAGARLRALYRAAEVYAEHVVPPAGPLSGPALEAAREKWAAVDPAALTVAGGLGLGAEAAAVWCPATSLLGGATVLVPAAALRPFGPYNRDRLAEPTSAGTGAGGSPREAAARGLLTALGHDALRRALHGTSAVRRVDPAALAAADDAELTFLVRSAANLGVELDVLDLGEAREGAVPTVLARAAGRWALGSALRRRDAVLEAVRDLLGAVQVGAVEAGADPLDTGDPLLKDLDPGTLAVTSPSDGCDLAAGTGWGALAEQLRAAGRDVLAAPAPAPDLAAGRLHATRVLLTTADAPHAR
jgi:bacteriocin biosynthesis cyclodehydratase domain-containing protein